MRRLAPFLALAVLGLAAAPVAAMPDDNVPWVLADEPQRAVVADSLAVAPRPEDLGDNHYFLITFDTRAKGVELDGKLRARFPQLMTIILQYDYRVVAVGDEAFTVELHFDDAPQILTVPYAAVTAFRDPPMGLNLFWEPTTAAPDRYGKP